MIVKLNINGEEARFLKHRYGSCVGGLHELVEAEQVRTGLEIELDLAPNDLEELEDAAAFANMSPARYAEIIVEAHLSMRRRLTLWSDLE